MRASATALTLLIGMLVTTHVAAQSPPGSRVLTTLVREVEASFPLPSATVGFRVIDAATGRVLFEDNGDTALNPASNTKLLTAAAALSLLGPSYHFDTTVLGTRSPTDPSVVTGELTLRGEGDPALSTGDLYALARSLHDDGVRRIEGDLVVDESAFGTEHLPPAFEQQPNEQNAFRAAVGAVSIDENAAVFHLRPGATAGTAAMVTITPRGYFDLDAAVQTTDTTTALTVETPFSPVAGERELARIRGTIPLSPTVTLLRRRLANPGAAAAYAFLATLRDAGITVTGAVRVSSTPTARTAPVLASHRSAPLSTLLLAVGKDSNNFTAEMTLLAIAARRTGPTDTAPITFARGAERMVTWARTHRIDTTGMVVRNGSGLFDANRLSPHQLTDILRTMWREPTLRHEYIAQLAANGDDGTLHTRLRAPTPLRIIRAKTGTLDDVVALSGYILTPDPARAMIFSYLANGVRGNTGVARQRIDTLLTRWVAARLQ